MNFSWTTNREIDYKKLMTEKISSKPMPPSRIITGMIEVLAAFLDCRPIQWRPISTMPVAWEDTPNPVWDFQRNQYRVKPEPRKFWIVKFPHGHGGYIEENYDDAKRYAQDHTTELIHVVEIGA